MGEGVNILGVMTSGQGDSKASGTLRYSWRADWLHEEPAGSEDK